MVSSQVAYMYIYIYDLPPKKTPNRLDPLLPKRGQFSPSSSRTDRGLDAFNDGPLCWA